MDNQIQHKPECITIWTNGKKIRNLVWHCNDGCSPREALSLLQECGIDHSMLNKCFLVREASPIPVHPIGHPFISSCLHDNLPVVRLLMELGQDPDALITYHPYHPGQYISARQCYADKPALQDIFAGGKHWWKQEYPEARRLELQNALEKNILEGEASEAIWLMCHGVRLASPAILASKECSRLPEAFLECVCRMGIPTTRIAEFQSWIKKCNAVPAILDIMDTLLLTHNDEGKELAWKIINSCGLINEKTLEDLLASFTSISMRISLLQHCIRQCDIAALHPFIAKTITSLFWEILCKSIMSFREIQCKCMGL
ncbi:MAG: hypothetical protein J5746_08985 [Victivallales bacterium]|nr:hypothetical protein [Victivallales bacterium]